MDPLEGVVWDTEQAKEDLKLKDVVWDVPEEPEVDIDRAPQASALEGLMGRNRERMSGMADSVADFNMGGNSQSSQEAAMLGEEPARRQMEGRTAVPELGVQLGGAVGAMGIDAVITGVIGALPQGFKDFTMDQAEAFFNTEAGQMVQEQLGKGMEVWDEFEKRSPQNAKTAVAMMDFGVLSIPKKAALYGLDFAKKASNLRVAGLRNKHGMEFKRIKKMVQPDSLLPNPKKGANGLAGEEGLARRATYEFMEEGDEAFITSTLSTFDSIKPSRSYRYNLGAIHKDIIPKLEKELQAHLGKYSKNKWTVEEVGENLQQAINGDLRGIPGYHTMVGDGSKAAQNVLEDAMEILQSAKKTPKGLLAARRKFDDAMLEGGADLGMDAAGNAKNKVATYVRRELNDQILRLTDDATYDLVQSQHRMLQASDIFMGKAVAEQKNIFTRTGHFLKRHFHLPTTALSLMVLGSAAATAPVIGGVGAIATVGAGTWAAWKILAPRQRNRALAGILTQMDKARKSAGGKLALDTLKADRAAIVGMMKMGDDQWENFVSQREAEAKAAEEVEE
jgi:hypothetical protein